MIRFSLSLSHTPWREDRAASCREMLMALTPLACGVPFLLNDTDYRGTDWQVSKVKWAIDQWRWALSTPATSHHLFLTDDLYLAPNFWEILDAMVQACPDQAIGLLSNHPHSPDLGLRLGKRWYRCGAWLVGPAYVLPRALLSEFLARFLDLPDGNAPGAKGYGNDDSSINEFLSTTGRYSYHPIPTIIEHRGDLPSTVGHGDRYSRQRMSWRKITAPIETAQGIVGWSDDLIDWDVARMIFAKMNSVDFWLEGGGAAESPILPMGDL